MTPEQELANRLAADFLRVFMREKFADAKPGADVTLTPAEAEFVGRVMKRANALAAAAFLEAVKPEPIK